MTASELLMKLSNFFSSQFSVQLLPIQKGNQPVAWECTRRKASGIKYRIFKFSRIWAVQLIHSEKPWFERKWMVSCIRKRATEFIAYHLLKVPSHPSGKGTFYSFPNFCGFLLLLSISLARLVGHDFIGRFNAESKVFMSQMSQWVKSMSQWVRSKKIKFR